MMNLEELELDSDAKNFISSIVDNYVLGKEYISDGSNPDIITPGAQVQNIFVEFIENHIFNISIHKDKDFGIEVYYKYDPKLIKPIGNEDDYDAEERFLKIKKSEFINKIFLLNALLDSGYIYLVDDKDCNLFNNGKITEKDKKRWEKNGIKYNREIIRSEVLYDFISRFHGCTIIPSPQLIRYKKKGFRTPEQIRFNKTLGTSWIAIGVSFIIGIGSPLLMTKCSKTSIDSDQLDKILNAIPQQVDEIKLNKAQMDSVITIITNVSQPNNG